MSKPTYRHWILGAAFLVLLLAIGTMGMSCKDGNNANSANEASTGRQSATQPAVVYTCPMHPQIRESKPGKCPICQMDLVEAK